MSALTVSALYHFVVKSCAGNECTTLDIDERGPAGDRLLMITDEQYSVLTQRPQQGGYAKMALIRPVRREVAGRDFLQLFAPRMPSISGDIISEGQSSSPVVRATVFQDICEGIDQGEPFATWLTRFLDVPCRLVHIEKHFKRQCDPTFVEGFAHTGFADGFPILLISDASLADLNRRLVTAGREPVSRENFRAAFWVTGCEPYEEDTWKRIRINGVEFDLVKPCARCPITQVDWERGAYRTDKEPLKTLQTYRHQKIEKTGKEGVMFGQNVVHRGIGSVHVGDEVRIVQRKR